MCLQPLGIELPAMTLAQIELVTRRLIHVGAPKAAWIQVSRVSRHFPPKDFVILVLLCSWMQCGILEGRKEWDLLEFFSGKGRVSTMGVKAGLRVASYEILRDEMSRPRRSVAKHHFPKRSFMDFNEDAGFVCLAAMWYK